MSEEKTKPQEIQENVVSVGDVLVGSKKESLKKVTENVIKLLKNKTIKKYVNSSPQKFKRMVGVG